MSAPTPRKDLDMTNVLDRVERLLAASRSTDVPACIVCRRPIRAGDRRMTVRGTVQVHQLCATYRMRQVDAGATRAGYPPR
ncbi:MAG: hypothetical protein ACR2IN_02570 [Thermoleophilaceae bacterium]